MRDNRIKILYVLRMIGFGGAERQVVELCQGLDKNLFEVTVVLFFHTEGYWDELQQSGVRVIVLAQKENYKRVALIRLIKFLKKEKFDIVHTLLPIANFGGGLAARLVSKSLVVGALRNASPFSWKDPFCLMDLIALNFYSHRVIVNAYACKKCAMEKYNVPEKKIHVIHNGKRFDTYQKNIKSQDIRAGLNVPPGNKVITSIGRVSEQKGHRYLVEAANVLVHEMKLKITFFIVGKAEESYDEVVSLIRKYSLEDSVHLLGVRENIADILGITDIFVHCSLWEGLANVVLEAMIAKVPIIASDIDSNQEALEQDKTGILVPQKDPLAIANAVSALLSDTVKMKRLSDAAYQSAVDNFGLGRLVKEHENYYQEVLLNEKNC